MPRSRPCVASSRIINSPIYFSWALRRLASACSACITRSFLLSPSYLPAIFRPLASVARRILIPLSLPILLYPPTKDGSKRVNLIHRQEGSAHLVNFQADTWVHREVFQDDLTNIVPFKCAHAAFSFRFACCRCDFLTSCCCFCALRSWSITSTRLSQVQLRGSLSK